jgi:hypothetical protein
MRVNNYLHGTHNNLPVGKQPKKLPKRFSRRRATFGQHEPDPAPEGSRAYEGAHVNSDFWAVVTRRYLKHDA